jgi:hypothetical protein
MAGRPKGSTNHQAAAIKDMLRAALDKVGGLDYFVRQAEENPTAFMTLIGKTIPADVNIAVSKTAWEMIDEAENVDGNATQA